MAKKGGKPKQWKKVPKGTSSKKLREMAEENVAKRGPGRPPGSRNKVSEPALTPPKKGSKKATSTPESPDVPNALFEAPTGSLDTLLDIPARRELPQFPQHQGRPSKLYALIHQTPENYAKFLFCISDGMSFNVAAEMAGIGERTFYEWGAIGRNDFEREEDTYHARFVQDVRRAAAHATGSTEAEVRRLEPRKWLAHGPARIFGDRWAKDPNAKSLPNTPSLPNPNGDVEAIEGDFQVLPPTQLPSPSGRTPALTDQREFLQVPIAIERDALGVLESMGIVKVSPEFKEAMERQIHGGQKDSLTPNLEESGNAEETSSEER